MRAVCSCLGIRVFATLQKLYAAGQITAFSGAICRHEAKGLTQWDARVDQPAEVVKTAADFHALRADFGLSGLTVLKAHLSAHGPGRRKEKEIEMNRSRQTVRVISYELIMTDAELGVEVYANKTGHSIMGFSGKRYRPDFHHRFSSLERAEQYIVAWHDRLRAIAKAKVLRKQSEKGFTTCLIVGDVLRCGGAWKQTSIEYYEVTRVIDRCTVEIRRIAATSSHTRSMVRECAPLPGEYIGEAFPCRVLADNSVRINSYQSASKKSRSGSVQSNFIPRTIGGLYSTSIRPVDKLHGVVMQVCPFW